MTHGNAGVRGKRQPLAYAAGSDWDLAFFYSKYATLPSDPDSPLCAHHYERRNS
jgi:hypothetical protein